MGLRFRRVGRTYTQTPAFLIILLIAVWSSGCGDASQKESTITGTWQRNVARGTASFVGLLTLGQDGSFSFSFVGNAAGHERSDGRYSLSGRDIKFENKSCKGVGRYRYLLKDSTLAFIPIADGCARRKAVISGTWQRHGT